jgi:NAD+ kinase
MLCDYSGGAALAHAPAAGGAGFGSVELLLRSDEEVAYLSLDGQPGLDLKDGDRVRCRRSEHKVSLFRTDHDFFHVLRTKLKWGER